VLTWVWLPGCVSLMKNWPGCFARRLLSPTERCRLPGPSMRRTVSLMVGAECPRQPLLSTMDLAQSALVIYIAP
jgi:hypothetical protein